jgi:hypothetical protein
VEYQLRTYRIQAGKLEPFLAAWRTGVYPLRQAFGFTVVGAWVLADTHEFVWILAYRGPEGFVAADAAYYASAERAALDPDPAPYIEHAEERFMTSVLASPPPTLPSVGQAG